VTAEPAATAHEWPAAPARQGGGELVTALGLLRRNRVAVAAALVYVTFVLVASPPRFWRLPTPTSRC